MTTFSNSAPFDNSTVANYKAWGQAIGTGLAAVGWTKTTDTGQVNWSAVTTLPSYSYANYEIWKSSDSLSSTLPMYLKIGYGLSSTQLNIQLTPGMGSDGAGNITGAFSSTPWTLLYTSIGNKGSSLMPCFFSSDGGDLRVFLWQNGANVGLVFGVERSKNASGNATADYFTALTAQANATNVSYQQTILASGLIGNLDSGIIAPTLTSGSATGSFNGTVAALPVFPMIGKCGNPMTGFVVCCGADVGDGALVTVSDLYGATRTYVAAKEAFLSNAVGYRSSNGTSMALLLRYE